MNANTIVLLCFLFATFRDCTSTNIYSHLGRIFDSPYAVTHEAREEVENIYIQSFISDVPRDDPVCALTAERKKALCELILQIAHYRNGGIYLSKIPLHLARLPCEEKLLSFKRRSDFLGKMFDTNMYPCHGRHQRVRTSFIEDIFYDKFYVSGGPDLNSVTVYIHEYDVTSDWYTVYDYIHNVNVFELRDMFITVKEVTAELKLNRSIISTLNYVELSCIFVREQDYIKTDPICDLEYERKISLCQTVFSSAFYSDKFHVALNKAAVYILDMACEKNLVSIGGFPESRQIAQDMYPCYARKEPATGNVLSDQFIKRFYVSRGPRRNSVFVYLRENEEDHSEKFSIIDLLENVLTRHLKPTEITDEEVVEESPNTYLKMQELVDEEERRAELSGVFQKSITSEEVTEKMKKFEEMKLKRKEEIKQSLENTLKISEVKKKFHTLDVIFTEEELKKSHKDRKQLKNLNHVWIGPQVTKRLKAKRETELASETYFEATTSSERLRKKLAQRKLMTKKSESTLTEEKFVEEEAKKLIEEMEKSLRIKKAAEGKLSEKEKIIPEKKEEGVKESDKRKSESTLTEEKFVEEEAKKLIEEMEKSLRIKKATEGKLPEKEKIIPEKNEEDVEESDKKDSRGKKTGEKR